MYTRKKKQNNDLMHLLVSLDLSGNFVSDFLRDVDQNGHPK